jgi:hypothetical protein
MLRKTSDNVVPRNRLVARLPKNDGKRSVDLLWPALPSGGMKTGCRAVAVLTVWGWSG